jgi:N-acetylglucosaminyldiphosphoundecaprenol N-acetyl-beta-D-mannosaminyltransferase
VHLCNAHNIALASRSRGYAELLNRADLNLADGAPLVFLARRLGISDLEQANRPRGADVFAKTVDKGRSSGLRHYLYGSEPRTVAALTDRLRRRYPGLEIVGAEAPPFRPLTGREETETVERIRAAAPHIVWVALGTPRQDEFVDHFRDLIGVTLVAVGAAFDFLAGTKPQAPSWMQRAGVEWLFRLASEPRRLWKRYLVGNFLFLAAAARGVRIVEGGFPGAVSADQ